MKKRLDGEVRVAGRLTITRFKDGVREVVGTYPNKVVMSDGYGRNLVARQLAGDAMLPLAIDSASIGSSGTAAADAQTDLVSPVLEDIPITNATAVDDVVTVDVFVADVNLADGTYRDFPPGLDFFVLTMTRAELQDEIDRYLELEREAVGKVREIVNALTLYSPEDVAKVNAAKEELLDKHKTVLERVHAGIAERSYPGV